jgi:ribA/ribD-fused uncharacterized protein
MWMKRGRGLESGIVFCSSPAGKRFTFFWRPGKEDTGWLSNWSPHGFRDDSDQLFATAEHYIMYRKAVLMKDDIMALEIPKANSARKAKAMGRKVSNWDESLWEKHREGIVYDALRQKVEQNLDVKQWLIDTGDSVIAEASPSDKVWGIGLKSSNRYACVPEKWPGENLLGKMWMKVRNELSKGKKEKN